MKTDISISKDATNAEIASWYRGQTARMGQPIPAYFNDDATVAHLALFLVTTQRYALAYQVAEQSRIPRLADSVRGAAARCGVTV